MMQETAAASRPENLLVPPMQAAGSLAHRLGRRFANAPLSARITFGALVFIVVTSLLVIVLFGRHERERLLAETGVRLDVRTRLTALQLAQEVNALRQDVLFLANTPPIQGIARAAANKGFDREENDSIEIWHKRLREIFLAFAKAHPDYAQVRYIGLADNGRELERVDNQGERAWSVPAADLQAVGDREYFQAALRLKAGEIYLSEFNLSREDGRVTVPYVRTLRAATPVFARDGRLFGMVVINMDVGRLLDSMLKTVPGTRIYLMNDKGDYLVHADASRTFGFDLDRRARWQEDFPGAPFGLAENVDSARTTALQLAQSPYGPMHVMLRNIHFDPQQPQRYLALAFALPDAIVQERVADGQAVIIGGSLLSMLLVGALFLVYVRRSLAPLRPLTRAAHEIGSGHYDAPLPKGGSGEIAALIAAFRSMQEGIASRDREIRQLNAGLEQQVEERTAELQAANRELESYAYAIAHDLRAPLRSMTGFSQALVEDYGPSLDGEARDYLDQIIIGGRRMGDLVDGLLTLSRSTRGELQRDRVDISAMAERLLAELSRTEPERQVTWDIETGLSVRCDARMLEVVMRNLLGNAWKYTAATPQAHIRVHAERRDGKLLFCVSDNGAGFDMAHAGKLFKPFQRLHRQEEFAGIGIGLATVQRIVHRHGGEIEAEAAKGQGARFCFHLGHGATSIGDID